jgi:RNase P subunit RPR2
MPRSDEPIEPMTLGNVRQNVRRLFVTCQNCGHQAAVNVDVWPVDVAVPSFGPRMQCIDCGKLGRYGHSELD